MNLNSDLRRNSMIVQFLGKTQREDLIGLIEEYTSQEYIEKYRGIFDDPMLDSSLNQLQQNAIMALTRLGGKSAIPKLRQLYNSPDIRVRIISALALYYNGDKTGEKLLMHFVKGDQRSVPEIEIRWSRDLAGGAVFQSVIGSYLRSKFTDELLLEKFRNYIESEDINLEPGFFENNRNQLLPILVRQLNNRDRQTRDSANRILKQMTGQDFGFDSSRYAGRQDEIVKQWQKYIEELLSKSSEK